MKKILGFALMAFVATACAAGMPRSDNKDPLSRYDGYIGAPVREFTAMNTQSWQPVSRDQLIIWTGIDKAWLLKVQGYCPDLQFAQSVRVTSTTSTISTFDQVLVGRDRCPISEIRPIDVRQMKADRKELKQ